MDTRGLTDLDVARAESMGDEGGVSTPWFRSAMASSGAAGRAEPHEDQPEIPGTRGGGTGPAADLPPR